MVRGVIGVRARPRPTAAEGTLAIRVHSSGCGFPSRARAWFGGVQEHNRRD